jgi:hypothetical protein
MAEPGAKQSEGTPKPPSVDELRRHIGEERDALTKSLDKLADEVGEASEAARRQAAAAGRKARVIGPGVAGAVVALLAARGLLRLRRRRPRD